MQLNLQVTTPAAATAVDLEELKSQLRIDADEEDYLAQEYLDAVTDQLEAYLGLSLIQKTYLWVLDGFGVSREPWDDFWYQERPSGFYRGEVCLTLPRSPLVSVSSIQYKNTANTLTTLDSSTYQIDTLRVPARIKPAYGELWPQTGTDFNAVQVSFIAGYGATSADVPPRIRHAIRMLVGHFEENRTATAAVNIYDVPLGWKSLVEDYRAKHYA